MSSIAAIIPTVGRPEMLRKCLESLAAQTRRPSEIIVVHCGDDAATRQVVEDPRWIGRGMAARYYHSPVRNAAQQRNFAVAQTPCDLLMLLDDDVELEAEWVRELAAPIEADPSVGATMGSLSNQRLDPPSWYWRLYRRLAGGRRAVEPGRLAGAALPNGFPDSALAPLSSEWLGGGVAAIRRTAFESVGGFAPYFDGSSPGEDLDLGYRLSRHWRVLFVPTARAFHHSAALGRSPSGEYQYQSIRSRFAILLRACEMSRLKALWQVLLWMMFQGVSELLSRRSQGSLGAVWAGRWRGLRSCLRWQPPANQYQPALFPRLRQ